MNLIGFLVAVLVILIVVYVCKLVVDFLELPPPVRTIALLIIGLVCLLMLLNSIGVVGAPVFRL